MKKRLTAIALSVCAIFGTSTGFAKDYPQKFWDVDKTHWAFEYIADLAERGVVSGYEDGSFLPNKTVTRAEWSKIMVDAAGVPTTDSSVAFTDMDGHWANKYVNAAQNYLTGYTDGSYRPNQAAVREDVTVAMVALKGYSLDSVDYSVLSKFTDNDSISNYAKKYVAVAIQNGLISGFEDNTFRGQATLTRAEAATLLFKAFQKGSNNKVPDISGLLQVNEPSESAPTATPTPTETPEQAVGTGPIETLKPYAVDTIIKTQCEGRFQFAKDKNDNLYYVEDNCIYMTNIYDGNKEKVVDGIDVVVDDDEMTLTEFKISGVCYDDVNGRVMFTGNYSDDKRSMNHDYLYAVQNKQIELIDGEFRYRYDVWSNRAFTYLFKVLNDGTYVMVGYISSGYSTSFDLVDAETLERRDGSLNNMSYVIYDMYDNDTELYLVKSSGLWVNNYVEEKQLWENKNDYRSVGIADNTVVCGNSEEISVYNFNGKQLKNIPISDITVYDRAKVDFSTVSPKLYITNNGDVVFLDTTADAFRILKGVTK